MNRFLILCLHAALALAPLQVLAHAPAPEIEAAPNCGVQSVINFARYAGKTIEVAQVEALKQAYPQSEVSLFEVQQAAKAQGLELEGVRISATELTARGVPFIAAMPDHFQFVERLETDWVRIAETNGLQLVPRADWERDYRGIALLPASQISRLKIAPALVALGQVPFGTPHQTVQVTVSNPTRETIAIQDISTSCSCTVPSQWPREVKAGDKFTLSIGIDLPSGGNFSQTVSIAARGEFGHQTISLWGRVENDVMVDPPLLHFGETVPTQTLQRTLTLRDPEKKLPRPLQVRTSAPDAKASIRETAPEVFEVEVKFQAPAQTRDWEAALIVSGAPAPDGTPQGRQVQIPLRASVVNMNRSSPPRLIYGSISQPSTRTLRVYRQDKAAFTLEVLDAPVFLRIEKSPLDAQGTQWILKVTLSPAQGVTGNIEPLHLQLKTNGQNEEFDVPIAAIIETSVPPGAAQAALLPRAEDDAQTPIGLALPTVKIGQPAPNFAVTDADGNRWKLNSLRGQKNLLLTFFPKCFTGGCANHLSSLRDHQNEFDQSDVQILAVSTDAAEGERGQRAFAAQWQLSFPLIPDTQRTLSKLYGAAQNVDERAARMTILIDKNGLVRWIDTDVNVQTHGADVLDEIRELKLD